MNSLLERVCICSTPSKLTRSKPESVDSWNWSGIYHTPEDDAMPTESKSNHSAQRVERKWSERWSEHKKQSERNCLKRAQEQSWWSSTSEPIPWKLLDSDLFLTFLAFVTNLFMYDLVDSPSICLIPKRLPQSSSGEVKDRSQRFLQLWVEVSKKKSTE